MLTQLLFLSDRRRGRLPEEGPRAAHDHLHHGGGAAQHDGAGHAQERGPEQRGAEGAGLPAPATAAAAGRHRHYSQGKVAGLELKFRKIRSRFTEF